MTLLLQITIVSFLDYCSSLLTGSLCLAWPLSSSFAMLNQTVELRSWKHQQCPITKQGMAWSFHWPSRPYSKALCLPVSSPIPCLHDPLFQPRWPPCCSHDMPSTLLPQGFCTCSSLCQNAFPLVDGSVLCLLQVVSFSISLITPFKTSAWLILQKPLPCCDIFMAFTPSCCTIFLCLLSLSLN